jgi:hypothetical protein
MALTQQQQETLIEARDRAGKLIAELEQKLAEVEIKPPKLDARQLEEGKAAMRNAIVAVRKALENIEQAAGIADKTQRPPA